MSITSDGILYHGATQPVPKPLVGIANDQVINTVDLYVDGIYTVSQALDLLVNEKLRHQICISKQEIIDKYLTFKGSIAL